MRIAPLLAMTLVAAALAFAACDGDDGQPAPTATADGAQATAATQGPRPSATAAATPFTGSREPVEKPIGQVTGTPLLVDVRAAMHDGFDRIVFEFDAADPGFRAEYVDQAIACGSGQRVELQGVALLQVHVMPAAAHDEAGEPTFPRQELALDLPAIIEAKQTCDFEANVTWVIGLTEEVDFHAISLREPFRVVVDVAHP